MKLIGMIVAIIGWAFIWNHDRKLGIGIVLATLGTAVIFDA